MTKLPNKCASRERPYSRYTLQKTENFRLVFFCYLKHFFVNCFDLRFQIA